CPLSGTDATRRCVDWPNHGKHMADYPDSCRHARCGSMDRSAMRLRELSGSAFVRSDRFPIGTYRSFCLGLRSRSSILHGRHPELVATGTTRRAGDLEGTIFRAPKKCHARICIRAEMTLKQHMNLHWRSTWQQ